MVHEAAASLEVSAAAVQIDHVAALVAASVTRLRAMSPLWEMVQEGVDLKTVQWTPH